MYKYNHCNFWDSNVTFDQSFSTFWIVYVFHHVTEEWLKTGIENKNATMWNTTICKTVLYSTKITNAENFLSTPKGSVTDTFNICITNFMPNMLIANVPSFIQTSRILGMGQDHFFHPDIPFGENRTETGILKMFCH